MYCIATLNQHNLEVTHIWGSLPFWSIKKNGLDQWFSNFFSTGPHYGPSASLMGRTHVIYILSIQTKVEIVNCSL